MAQPCGPLAGVKVVACSTAQAGTVPYMLMADLGAEVIKIEVPGVGDGSRRAGPMPGFPSTYFETNNRGVQSLTLNLKAAEGRDILYKLVQEADVFGQNFRPGAAEKNGFGYETLKQVNPRIVYVSISGYGPRGPHAMLPGTDAMAQALGGIAEAFATPGQPFKPASSRWPMRRVRSWPLGASWPGCTAPRPPVSGRRLTPHFWVDRFVSWAGR